MSGKSVLAFACVVGLLVLLSGYCVDRDGDVDELAQQNPAYMMVHYGKIVYPACWFHIYHDLPMIIPPPIHVPEIGLLMRLGFSLYYAEPTPTVLFFLLAIVSIVRSLFPAPVKLGLLFSIGFVAATGATMTECFGARPEGELHAVWFCGLILLESGRLDNWNRARLLAGALLLTWASGLHYYAGFAWTGVLVYVVWAIRSLGWREGRSRVIALCAGGCLFGLPYLALYLVPYAKEVRAAIQVHQGSGGMGVAIQRHMDLYRQWSHNPVRPALLRTAMSLGVPLLVFSTAILAAMRTTRGMALAALPLQFFLLALARHKQDYYMVHESAWFAGAIAVGLLMCAERAVRYLSASFARAFPAVAALVLCVCLVWGSPMLASASISLTPRVHEVMVARAAARQILGPHAREAGRMGAWYSSGAEHWYDIQNDMLPHNLLFEPAAYFSNLDAVVDYVEESEGQLTGWYADGTLKLRGFFFGETNDELRLVYLSARRPPRVAGYVMRDHHLYHFLEDAAGDYTVLSALCPRDRIGWLWPFRKTLSSVLYFESGSPRSSAAVVTFLGPSSAIAPAGGIGQGCRVISAIPGFLRIADKAALLATLRDDTPMHFYRILEQMPGFHGVGLPAGAAPPENTIRMDDVLDLSHLLVTALAHQEQASCLRVATAPGMGAFSVFIPIRHPESVAVPCWVTLRLRVTSGRIGFAVFDSRKGILVRTPTIPQSSEPQAVALKVPDFHSATHILIFNESLVPTGGLVDILDAAVLVPRS